VGTIYYSVQPNNGYALNNFYVTNSQGQNVFIDLPTNLQSQAYQLSGQQVNLSGSWTPYAGAPNARFIPNGINTVATQLEQFSGILTQTNSYQLPGLQK